MLTQQIISGLATGSLYALAAIGLVLIYNTSDVVNFAQGEMTMFSTFVAFTLITDYHMSYFAAFILTIVFAGIVNYVVQKIVIKPIQDAPILSIIIATLGLMMIFNGSAGWFFGYETYDFPPAFAGENIKIFGAVISRNNVFILVLTAVIVFVMFYLMKTILMGIAIRATSQNPRTARLMGINVSQVYSVSWVVSGIFGAIAGMLIAPTTFLDVNMMAEVNLKAFTAAVLGGFSSLAGPVVGGLLLGVMENLVAGYISTELKSTFAFALIIIILSIKPTGLLGRTERKKV